MIDDSMLRWCIGAGLLVYSGCFDGSDALGLPCEQDFQCGNDQVCADGVCARPGDTTASASGSTTTDTTGTVETATDPAETATDPVETATDDTSGSTTGPPAPMTSCIGPRAITNREIVVTESGNPMSVGVGQFSDASEADIVVLTRSPGRLSVFRFDGTAFQFVADADVDDQPMDIAVGPLDDDGYDDVVVVDGSDLNPTAVTLFWGASDGLFVDPQTTFDQPLAFPQSVDIGRMVASTERQFVVSSGTAQNGTALFGVSGREPVRLFTHASVSASPWDTVLVDLNGEPPLEALVAGSNDEGLDPKSFPGSDFVHVLGAPAGNGLSLLQPLDAAHSPFGVDAGDLDGDGIPEVVVVGKNIPMPADVQEKSNLPSQISICSRVDYGDPLSCDTWQPGPEHVGYNNIRLADLNGDGELDAVIGTTGSEEVGDGRLLIAPGPLAPGFVPMEFADTGPIGNKLTVADVTGDGTLDIVVPLYGAEGSGQGVVRVYSCEGEG